MTEFSGGSIPQTMNAQSRRYMLAAGAVGVVFLLAVLTRRSSNAAPQGSGGEAEERTLYVPTQNETTIINYQSNNSSTTTGGDARPAPSESPPILSRLDPSRILRRVTSGRDTPGAPVSGGWDTSQALDGVQRLSNLQPVQPRTVAPDLPRATEAIVRVGYGRFFQDSPSAETLDTMEAEYQRNRERYPSLAHFENFFNSWASRQ